MNGKCINVSKRPLRPKFGFSGVHWQKLEKRGFFRSPIFHITCIIRNVYHFKNRPFSLFFRAAASEISKGLHHRRLKAAVRIK